MTQSSSSNSPDRQTRLAEALRANLRRRKEQERERGATTSPTETPESIRTQDSASSQQD